MTVREMQDEILRIKKEKDICILAHAYQRQDILDIADFVGDSFALSQMAAKAPQSTVLMCGVRFMAETVKILSPQKKVLLSDSNAGCPMAEQMDKDLILQLKEMYPDYKVVAYINTTSELKTVCDVCVTSSSAVKIVKKLDSDKILFIPDCNLGDYVQKQCPDKTFKPVSYTHLDVYKRQAPSDHFGDSFLLKVKVHPEDNDRYHKDLEKLSKGEEFEGNEYRWKNIYGDYIWILLRTATIRDRDGNIAKIVGVIVDIDRAKKSEKLSLIHI